MVTANLAIFAPMLFDSTIYQWILHSVYTYVAQQAHRRQHDYH